MMELCAWSKQLIHTSMALGKHEFYHSLSLLLKMVAPFDEMVVLHFRPNKKPKLLLQTNRVQYDDFELYLNKAYVLDPFYRLAMDSDKQGFFRLSDISPSGCTKFQSYYNSYFRHLKIIDEIGYLVRLPDAMGFIHIELANFDGSPLFLDTRIHKFIELFEVVSKMVCEHQQASLSFDGDCAEHNYIEEFHRLFASKVCTPREHEVVLLMLQGYSVKSIAQKMDLSVETIKMHRKNIYLKLNIGSQPELLALFINLLAIVEPPIKDDPLLVKLANDRTAVELFRACG
jgi:DNA-binding CsgD family transcriptional regulator